jgi:transposase
VVKHTDGKTLKKHMAQFTLPHATASTDKWNGYNQIERQRVTVNHGEHEWVRDDDGDGIREVHINTTKGCGLGFGISCVPFAA